MCSQPKSPFADDLLPRMPPSRHVPRRVGWLASLALLAAQGSAQPPAGQGKPPPGEAPSEAPRQVVIEGDEVTLATDQDKGLPLLEFVKVAQKVTGKTFVINQAKHRNLAEDSEANRIVLYGPLKIRKSEFFAFFQTLLFAKGWTCATQATGDGHFIALTAQPAPQRPKGEIFVLEPGEHDIVGLIQRSGQFLGRTYLVDTAQMPNAGQPNASNVIHVERRLELDRDGCEEVIGQVLRARGWIAVTIDVERGIYDWVWLQGPRQAELRKGVRTLPASEIRARPRVVDYVATTVRLQHANAQLTANNLRQFWTDPRGLDQILPLGTDQQGSLMVVGLRPNVAGLLAVLEAIDVPDPEAPTLAKRMGNVEARLQQLEAAPKEKR